jgi:hypothetical protein
MASIKVLIQILDLGLILPEAEIPDDMKASQIIDELTVELSLPTRKAWLTDGHVYELFSKSLGRSLHAEETIASAKIPGGDTLLLSAIEIPGGGTKKPRSRINFGSSSIGLPLDGLKNIEINNLLTNEPALMMTLHSYRTTLTQLEDSREELREADEEIGQLNDRLKEKNIATMLLLLGQIQIGFGTNLITNGLTGGWFVFLSGVAVNMGALFFSLFGLKRSGK